MTAGAGAALVNDLLAGAIGRRVFPAAVAEIGHSGGPIWREAFGTLTFEARARAADESTIFDLASLTKPIATTNLVLDLTARNLVILAEPVAAFFDEWRGRDREQVTIQDLLEHASGLPARLLDAPPVLRQEFEHDICSMPLEYQPRSRSLYSDLGFVLLGFLVGDRGNGPLDAQFDAMIRRIGVLRDAGFLGFVVPNDALGRTAPTRPLDEDVRRGRVLVGDVHDNYAAALGGAAGHSGLFGTAAAVGALARAVLRAALGDRTLEVPFTPTLVTRAITKSVVPMSSRALGWDTMLPTSSCGTRLSPAAFGHVGFTGTSLWIDPVLDRYFVLLANRACDGGTLEEMREVRRAFHDAAATHDF